MRREGVLTVFPSACYWLRFCPCVRLDSIGRADLCGSALPRILLLPCPQACGVGQLFPPRLQCPPPRPSKAGQSTEAPQCAPMCADPHCAAGPQPRTNSFSAQLSMYLSKARFTGRHRMQRSMVPHTRTSHMQRCQQAGKRNEFIHTIKCVALTTRHTQPSTRSPLPTHKYTASKVAALCRTEHISCGTSMRGAHARQPKHAAQYASNRCAHRRAGVRCLRHLHRHD